MININFSKLDVDTLHEGFTQHPSPQVRVRLHMLYLKSQGISHTQICELCRTSRPTLAKYLKAYQTKGIGALLKNNYKGQPSELHNFSEQIKNEFEHRPPSTLAEAADRIEKLTGLRRSIPQVRQFIYQLGFRRLKAGVLPGGPRGSSEEKELERLDWIENQLAESLEAAKAGQARLFFVDAAHFVYGAFLDFLYCIVRFFLPTPAGRKRYNVLGAIELNSKELITINNETSVNAETVCDLLLKIDLHYPYERVVIVLDNVSYQRAKVVRRLADYLGIELLFLPTYSPHLNLIERLWKFVKKECLNGKYYESFEDFKEAIERTLASLDENKDKINTLITGNFQSFLDVKTLA